VVSGLAVSLGVVAVLASLFGVALPGVAWLERKQLALLEGRVRPSRVTFVGLGVSAVLEPLARSLKWFGKREAVPATASPLIYSSAPLIALLPLVVAFAVIPFAGSYEFGATTLSLVIADIDWGIIFVIAMGILASFGHMAAGWSNSNPWSHLGALRALSRTLSVGVVLALSLVPMVLVFGTLRLGEMSSAQDHVVQLRTLPTWLGIDPGATGGVEGGFGYLGLPAWGILLQPVAFALVLVALSLHAGPKPTDTEDAGPELRGGARAEYGGLWLALFHLGEHARIVLMACVLTSVFLGGWSLPYLSQSALIAAVEPVYGIEFANLVCVLLHLMSFSLKVAALVSVQVLLTALFPRPRHDQLMALCWKRLLPFALVNVFVTALLILGGGDAA
jgi:NADH-quinone oxidoreductase subunit H